MPHLSNTFPIPQSNPPDHAALQASVPKIDTLFRTFMEKSPVPGLAYGIVLNGELVHAAGMGIQNVDTPTPVNPDSVFRIASMSKSFTGMALMKLRDDGKLLLDNAAAEYVPELSSLQYPTKDTPPITVRQLLIMTAGFPQDDPWADRHLDVAPAQLSEWIKGGISFSNPPGILFEYSNLGYGILGRIVSNVSGMSYQAYIRKNILEPLGMNSSTYDIHEVDPKRYAMGYRREGNVWAEETPLEDGEFGSMGGLFTTINDFARYMSFLMSAFPPRDEAETGPIRRSSAREMQQIWKHRTVSSARQSPDLPAVVQSDGYGYGLLGEIDSLLGYSVSHGGGLPGYGTFYRMLPYSSVGVVAFANKTYAAPRPGINDALLLLKRAGVSKPRTLPPAPALFDAQKAINSLYEQWDDEAITAHSTDSFFMDMPLDKRRKQVQQLRANFGKCLSVTPIEPENALRGRWVMQCSKGRIEVYTTLAPTVPPKIQVLQFTGAKPLNASLKQAVSQVLKLSTEWDATAAGTLFARSIKRELLQRQLTALRVQYGSLKLGSVLESDGQTQARVRLVGKQDTVDLRIVLNPKTGKISEISFQRPRETAFVP